ARATGLVIPAVAGKLDGVAVRVPVEDGSLTDLAVVLGRQATAADVNEAFAAAASGPMAGILTYSTDPIVSRDVIGDSASCVFDLGGDLLVGVPVDDRALGRPDHDGVGQHGEVDRHHDRAGARAERDPPDTAGRDEPAALGRHQLLMNRMSARWR